jgi:hypothetical protein
MRLILSLSFAGLLFAQETIRGIVPEEVLKARPLAKAGSAAPKPQYQPIGAQVVNALRQPGGGRQVGVTIWRLRPPVAGEAGARILVQEESHAIEWIPERVSSGSSLKPGDRVRLSIESPDAGYLYVIDRERYANGERGEPFLIFPTTRTREGDNRVGGGKLIDIPAQDDRPNFFRLKPGRPDQVEEELTVLLTTEPLGGIQIGREMLRLSDAQVARWEKEWGGGRVERFELAGGAGKTWTESEQQAAASATRVLTQEDPPPQTVYRVSVKPGDPLMIKVHLRYGKS